MDTARALQSDHPEVLMFRRRCLGDAEALYAKAKALADAGDDAAAVKVGKNGSVRYGAVRCAVWCGLVRCGAFTRFCFEYVGV